MKYVYVIEKAPDGTYSAYVPDLPGCTTAGATAEEVRSSIKDAVDSYVEALRDNNELVPQPSSSTDVVEAA